MMFRLSIISILFLSLFTGCQDPVDVPEPDNEEPVFTTDFSIDGMDNSLSAGEANYHLNSERTEDNGQFVYTSTFKNQDCPRDCANSLSISLYSFHSTNQRPDTAEFIKSRSREYVWQTDKDSQWVLLKHESKGSISRSIYQIGKMQYPVNQNTELKVKVARNEMLDICLEDYGDRIGFSRQCMTIPSDQTIPPRVRLTVKDPSIATLVADPILPFDRNRAVYHWGTNIMERSASINIDPSVLKTQEVCVTVNYGSADQGESRSCIKTENDLRIFDLVSEFSVAEFKSITPDKDIRPGRVVIQYIDDDRKRYTSRLFNQDPNAFFEIIDIADFKDPSLDEAIKVLTIRFSARLYNSLNDFIDIKSADTKLAIRYQ